LSRWAREPGRWKPRPSLCAIAAELVMRGHLAGPGKPFETSVVAGMLHGDRKKQKKGFQEQARAWAFG
jgi:hypothetical protein